MYVRMAAAFEMQVVDGLDVSWLEVDRMNRHIQRNDRTNGREVSRLMHMVGSLDEIDAAEVVMGCVGENESNCLEKVGGQASVLSSQMQTALTPC
jgi:hypothetical protein